MDDEENVWEQWHEEDIWETDDEENILEPDEVENILRKWIKEIFENKTQGKIYWENIWQ